MRLPQNKIQNPPLYLRAYLILHFIFAEFCFTNTGIKVSKVHLFLFDKYIIKLGHTDFIKLGQFHGFFRENKATLLGTKKCLQPHTCPFSPDITIGSWTVTICILRIVRCWL